MTYQPASRTSHFIPALKDRRVFFCSRILFYSRLFLLAGFCVALSGRAQAFTSVVAWGNNAEGETNIPPALTNFVAAAIAGGEFHSLAMRSNGTVIAWGDNTHGQ